MIQIPVKEVKFKVRRNSDSKLLAIEIFNPKFGWHHVLIEKARKYGKEAPIILGTFPDKIGEINLRELMIDV
jgi:hypothetical protein